MATKNVNSINSPKFPTLTDGEIYVGNTDGTLSAASLPSGTLTWSSADSSTTAVNLAVNTAHVLTGNTSGAQSYVLPTTGLALGSTFAIFNNSTSGFTVKVAQDQTIRIGDKLSIVGVSGGSNVLESSPTTGQGDIIYLVCVNASSSAQFMGYVVSGNPTLTTD